ncbi:hypothetical protein B0T16DRAFT_495584 [Cercophora newfieldiana]|uniref:Uncharacterized protein n=1 Tax=Cercophora newfieldiana TaxID=92897 RepID=A0AA40CJI5_9PEZI|nr:hypothetical protein B0T16DRAFT_495584 [Cercophora newfieldiana]
MKLLKVLVGPVLFSLALAGSAPFLTTANAKGSQELSIEFQYDKATAQSSLAVWNKDRTTLFGHSCSTSLNTFQDNPISFEVDQDGAGNLTIGSANFLVHEDANISGGVSCNRMYSPSESVVVCAIHVSQEVPLAQVSKRGLAECFSNSVHRLGQVIGGLKSGPTWAGGALPQEAPLAEYNASAHLDTIPLRKRQGACGVWNGITYRVGDGNPHQNPMNVQLSFPMHCERGECWAGHSESSSYGVSWSAGATAFQWINAGFAVEQSIQTGSDYNCKGNPGEVVCVWKNQAQTAYTVRNADYNRCTGATDRGGNYVMWSPNSDGRGSYYYCVHGAQYCRNKGDRWLDTNGRAGGP